MYRLRRAGLQRWLPAKVGAHSRLGIDYQFKNRRDSERRQSEQPAADELERGEVGRGHEEVCHAELDARRCSALVVVWAVAVTAATQDGRSARPNSWPDRRFSGSVVSASGAADGRRRGRRSRTSGGRRHRPPRAGHGDRHHDADDRERHLRAAVPGRGLRRAARGCDSLRGARDSRRRPRTPAGPFVIAAVPDGKYFVHVTPGAKRRRTPAGRRPEPAELRRRASCAASR